MRSELSAQDRQDGRLLRNVIFTFFVSGLGTQLGFFVPFLRETYGLSYDFTGLLISSQSVGNLIAVLLAGILPAYLGRRRTALFTSVWMLVGYLIFAAGLGIQPLLLAAFLMNGFAKGGNANFSNTTVSTLPGEKATRGYSLLHGAFALGALLCPLGLILMSSLMPESGWRVMAGLLCVAVAAQFVVYSTMHLPSEKPPEGIKALDRSFLRVKTFWMGAAMLFFYISAEYAINGWLVTYFQDIGVLSAEVAQLMGSLFWLFMFTGRMIGAAITGRFSRTAILVVDGVGLCICFLILFFARTTLVIVPALAGVALFMATIYPMAFAVGSESVRGNDLGCSIMIFIGISGGVVTPTIVGLVAEQAGISAGMGVVALITFLLLFAILVNVYLSRKSAPAAN